MQRLALSPCSGGIRATQCRHAGMARASKVMRCPGLHGRFVAESACQIGFTLADIAARRRRPVHAAHGFTCFQCQDIRTSSRRETLDVTMPRGPQLRTIARVFESQAPASHATTALTEAEGSGGSIERRRQPTLHSVPQPALVLVRPDGRRDRMRAAHVVCRRMRNVAQSGARSEFSQRPRNSSGARVVTPRSGVRQRQRRSRHGAAGERIASVQTGQFFASQSRRAGECRARV